MPTFETPEPISVTLELDSGTARVTAGKRTDTVAEVLPSNGSDDNDVRAVQQTEVSSSTGPADSHETVEVHARTGVGDITIRRA